MADLPLLVLILANHSMLQEVLVSGSSCDLFSDIVFIVLIDIIVLIIIIVFIVIIVLIVTIVIIVNIVSIFNIVNILNIFNIVNIVTKPPSLFRTDVHKGRFPSFKNVCKHWVIKGVHLDVVHFWRFGSFCL